MKRPSFVRARETHALGVAKMRRGNASDLGIDREDRGRDFVTLRGLEVAALDVYICPIDNWAEQLGRFASFLTGAHVSDFSKIDKPG
jgi:hypothetical protein